MSFNQISSWRRSSNKLRQSEAWLECLCLFSLCLATAILFLLNLANLPLLDPFEGRLASIAKEIHQSTDIKSWIFPTLWGEPFRLKSPLICYLVAILYRIAGVSELTTRFPGALLGALSVILVYFIGREIFVARLPALYSALVYLTCLPVVRYCRLATMDGALLSFELLTIWAVLRSRRNLQWTLITGLGFSLLSMTKGLFAWQILVIVMLFLWWDTPRLITSTYFWLGLAIGAIPGIAWYGVQLLWLHPGDGWNWFGLWSAQTSTLAIVSESISSWLHWGLFFFPWVLIMFAGTQSIQHNFHWGWGRLLATWLFGYIILGFLILPQAHWLVLPVFPPLALAAGKQLDQIRNLPSYVEYPRIWVYGFALVSALAALAALNWGIHEYIDFYLPFVCGSLSITFGATAVVIAQQDKQFILLLFWGLFVSILLLIISPHWIWELREVEPIKPIAQLLEQYTEADSVIYSSTIIERPSLSFYSDRQIIKGSILELKQHWHQDTPAYLLLDLATAKKLNLPQEAIVKNEQFNSIGWLLAVKR